MLFSAPAPSANGKGHLLLKNVYFSSKRRETSVRVGKFYMQSRMQQKEVIVEIEKW